MTDAEFDAMMERDAWDAHKRAMFVDFTPTDSEDDFRSYFMRAKAGAVAVKPRGAPHGTRPQGSLVWDKDLSPEAKEKMRKFLSS